MPSAAAVVTSPRSCSPRRLRCFGAPFPQAIGDEFFSYAVVELRYPEAIANCCSRIILDAASWTASASACRHLHSPRPSQQGGFRMFFSGILRARSQAKRLYAGIRRGPGTGMLAALAVGFLMSCGAHGDAAVGARRNLTMLGLSATVGEQIAALKRGGGRQGGGPDQTEPEWPSSWVSSRAGRVISTQTGASLGLHDG